MGRKESNKQTNYVAGHMLEFPNYDAFLFQKIVFILVCNNITCHS